MVEDGLNFGGEESGHYLLCDLATTSDAIVNALFVCKIYQERGSILDYTAECVDAPSVSANIALTDANAPFRLPTRGCPPAANRISSLYPNCRIVLRKSGTENKNKSLYRRRQRRRRNEAGSRNLRAGTAQVNPSFAHICILKYLRAVFDKAFTIKYNNCYDKFAA